jgi:hypothetical protein
MTTFCLLLGEPTEALLDSADLPLLSEDRWRVLRIGDKTCVACSRSHKWVLLHRLITGAERRVEHINGNGLDNRRANLRVCHGMTKTKTYVVWIGLRARCENPRHRAYRNYGGRGIRVCERWGLFSNFLADMGEQPPGMTIERRDNDGNYEPSNCYWTTRAAQNGNKRNTRFLVVNGERTYVCEASRRFGVPTTTLYKRLNKGWTGEQAVFTPR